MAPRYEVRIPSARPFIFATIAPVVGIWVGLLPCFFVIMLEPGDPFAFAFLPNGETNLGDPDAVATVGGALLGMTGPMNGFFAGGASLWVQPAPGGLKPFPSKLSRGRFPFVSGEPFGRAAEDDATALMADRKSVV